MLPQGENVGRALRFPDLQGEDVGRELTPTGINAGANNVKGIRGPLVINDRLVLRATLGASLVLAASGCTEKLRTHVEATQDAGNLQATVDTYNATSIANSQPTPTPFIVPTRLPVQQENSVQTYPAVQEQAAVVQQQPLQTQPEQAAEAHPAPPLQPVPPPAVPPNQDTFTSRDYLLLRFNRFTCPGIGYRSIFVSESDAPEDVLKLLDEALSIYPNSFFYMIGMQIVMEQNGTTIRADGNILSVGTAIPSDAYPGALATFNKEIAKVAAYDAREGGSWWYYGAWSNEEGVLLTMPFGYRFHELYDAIADGVMNNNHYAYAGIPSDVLTQRPLDYLIYDFRKFYEELSQGHMDRVFWGDLMERQVDRNYWLTNDRYSEPNQMCVTY